MTPLFVRQFKAENKCQSCRAKKAKGRSVCLYHLRLARERFAIWSAQRRELGKCILCERPSHRGFLRCKYHTEVNRQRCAAWSAKYGQEHSRAQWDKRKKLYRDQGLCVSCREHRPCAPGRARCQICLDKHNASKRAKRAA